MTPFTNVTLNVTGNTLIAKAGENVGPEGWLIQLASTSWTGSLVLKSDQSAPGAAQNLVNVAYQTAGTWAIVAAGTALTSAGGAVVSQTGYDLYAAYTHTAGSVTVTVSPISIGATAGSVGALSAIDVTAGTFGAATGETGAYAFPGTVSGTFSGTATAVGHALTGGTYITSGGTFDGSAARTFAVDATNANTVSKVVARDASGNFSAGTITAALTGAASTNTTQGNALRAYLADGMLAIGTITVSGGDATKFKTTTTAIYTISGAAYTKAATDTLAFSSAGTINVAGAATTAHWGVWLVQINAAGTISTKAPGGGTTDQDYATEALAIAALPAVDASNCQLGYITVQGLASTSWAATTSNLTVGAGAGNCTARNFYDLPAAKTLPAAI